MVRISQQVLVLSLALIENSIRSFLSTGLLCSLLLVACDAPARDKPWRHESQAGEGAESVSPLVAQERERRSAKRARLESGEVHVELRRDPGNLFPLSAPRVWAQRIVQDSVYETLTRATSSGNSEPWLADRVADWGREIRIRLRPDVTFHDGTRLTAMDVQFSLDSARHGKSQVPHLRPFLSAVSSVQIVSSSEVRIRLSRLDRYPLRALSLVPIVKSHKTLAAASRALVGTGPYRIDKKSARQIQLSLYQGYWGKAPAVPRWSFVVEPDGAKSLARLRDADTDIVAQLSRVHSHSGAMAGGLFETLSYEPAQFTFALFNMAEGPLVDINLRRAIRLLVDQDRIVSEAYRGKAVPRSGPVWPGGPIDGPSQHIPKANLDEANRLLDEAGWLRGEAGQIRMQEGRRLVLTVLATEASRPDRDLVIDALRSAGFFVDLRTGSVSVLKNRLQQGAFHLAFLDWDGPSDRPAVVFHSKGKQNWGQLRDKQVDRLLDRLAMTKKRTARTPIVLALHERLVELAVFASMPTKTSVGVASRRLSNLPDSGWITLRDIEALVPL